MRILLILAILAMPLAFAAHTPQGDCDADGRPALGITQVGEGEDAYYVDDRGDVPYVYEESNGIWSRDDPAHSLQRGGENAYVPDDDDACVDDPLVVPDARLF